MILLLVIGVCSGRACRRRYKGLKKENKESATPNSKTPTIDPQAERIQKKILFQKKKKEKKDKKDKKRGGPKLNVSL